MNKIPTSFTPVSTTPISGVVTVTDGVVAVDCKKTKAFKTNFLYNPETFIKADNTKYNPEISQLTILLSTDIYAHCSVVFQGDSTKTEDCLAIYSRLGFKNPEFYELNKRDYEENINDLTSAVFSHQEYTFENKNYSIIFAVIRGTDGTFEQWFSNFNLGSTGNHKGLNVAANRLNIHLTNYLEKYTSFENTEKILVITGHSRGAGIANILGKNYEEAGQYKTFAYTFGGPRSTFNAENSAKTIFNLVNDDDIVPLLTPEIWGFKNFGTDIYQSVQKNYQKWEEYLGVKYKSAKSFSDKIKFDIPKRMKALSSDRTGVYAIDDSKQNRLKNIRLLINKKYVENQIEKYGLHTHTEGLNYKNGVLSGKICPAYVIQTLAVTVSVYTQGGMKNLGKILKFIFAFYPTCKPYFLFTTSVIRAGSFMSSFSLQRSHSVTSYILLSQTISF